MLWNLNEWIQNKVHIKTLHSLARNNVEQSVLADQHLDNCNHMQLCSEVMCTLCYSLCATGTKEPLCWYCWQGIITVMDWRAHACAAMHTMSA